MVIGRDSTEAQQGFHVFGDDQLLVTKPLLEDLNGLSVVGSR